MKKAGFNALFSTAACLFLGCRTGLALQLMISPNEVNEFVPKNVIISCRVGLSDADVKEVVMLQIVTEKDVMAAVSRGTRLSLGERFRSNFKVEGDISGSIENSFIRVRMFNPQKEDSCSYRCVLSFLDSDGIARQIKEGSNLTVYSLDPKSPVRYLAKKVASLESKLSVQQEQISALLSKIHSQQLTKRQLVNTENTVVSFTALHNGTGVFKVGQDLVYGNVVENVGGAYNGRTGVFTAPFTGYYLLHISLSSDTAQRWLYVDLKSNKGQILTRVAAYIFADTSIVARLEAGVEAKPVIRHVAPGFTFRMEENPDTLNKFYGYLLKML